jgi:Xaa-Pro aminopeptidase
MFLILMRLLFRSRKQVNVMSPEFDRARMRRERLDKTYAAMKRLDLDGLVATTFDNVRYISDCRPYFTAVYYVSAYAVILPFGKQPIIQGPVVEGAPLGLAPPVKGWNGYPMIPVPAMASKWASMVSTILKDNGVASGRVGIDDSSFMSYLEITKSMPQIQIVPAFDAMLQARAIKTHDEITLLRKAAELVDIGAETGLAAIKPGVRERDVVAKMAAAMYEAGSEAEPWAGSVSSGERSLSSILTSDRMLKEGDLAVFDIGSIHEGYLGDIARTGAAGTPSKEARVIYTAAYDALMAGTKAVKPGVFASEVDGKIRQTLADAQCNIPPLSTGHGIGVGAPEIPWITPKEEGIVDYELKAGMVLCLEPRTSRDGVTAAGCEDTILVTDSGYDVLTKCPRQEHLLID